MRQALWSLRSACSPCQLFDQGYSRKLLLVCCLLGTILCMTQQLAHADSPPPLVTNIDWDEDPTITGNQHTFAAVTAIEAAYNNAHRQEEAQLGLAPGALGDLHLPTDVQWSQVTLDKKVLILINAERRARADIGQGISGLPLAGIDQRLTTIAQHYADLLFQSNTSGHLEDGSPFDRVNAVFGDPTSAPTTACREFLPYVEALASFWTTGSGSPAAIGEQAVYNWLYRDLSSAWGHRATLLIQDTQSAGQGSGYHNNVGSPQHEGLLGIGHAAGPGYDPLGWGWPTWGEIVVLNLIDPSVNAGCASAGGESSLRVDRTMTTPRAAAAGEIVTATLTLLNNGSTLLTGINLTDTVNSQALTYLTATIAPTTVDSTTGKLVWRDLEGVQSGGTLDPMQSITITVRLVTTGLPLSPTVQSPKVTAYSAWHTLIMAIEQRSLAWRFYLPAIFQ